MFSGFAAAVFTAWFITSTALAQGHEGAREKSLGESGKQAAREHYNKGIEYLSSPAYGEAPIVLQEAVRELNRCLSIDPNHFWARFGLGIAYLKLGDFTETRDRLKALTRGEIADPDLAFSTHYYLGVAYLHLVDHKEAIPPLKKAIDILPYCAHYPIIPNSLKAKWNLRVAYYASDHRYPDDLPEKYRLNVPTSPVPPPVRFTDVARQAGVDAVNLGRGSAWGDYDRDGDLDLFTVAEGSPHHLYRNDREAKKRQSSIVNRQSSIVNRRFYE